MRQDGQPWILGPRLRDVPHDVAELAAGIAGRAVPGFDLEGERQVAELRAIIGRDEQERRQPIPQIAVRVVERALEGPLRRRRLAVVRS